MRNYCQLEHLQLSSYNSSDFYETGIAFNDDGQSFKSPLGFLNGHILIQVSTPKSPFYFTPRTTKTPGHHSSGCSSPVRDYDDNYYPRNPGYISPKLGLPFIMAPNISFKPFKIQDGGNYQICGYAYPYAVVTPHKIVITPRRTDWDDNNEEEDEEEGIYGLLLERMLHLCRSLPEFVRVQLLNLKGLDELASVEGGSKIGSTISRGLVGPMEDLPLRLDRFKIRTVDIDDEVIMEEKK